MKRPVHIGILLSRSGGYQAIAHASQTGARAAIARVNADPALSVRLIPVERDPGGQLDLYAPLCQDILATSDARHILGCVTSSSRKEVLPVLERAGATLWYPLPYEGFEASEHVAYLHACPNQHLLPLLGWALPRFGRRVHLVGSNYIWGWEINRLAREVVTQAGGEIARERHLPLGETDVARIVVMYMGQIVETGTRAQIFGNPQHAYTRRLIDSVPVPDPFHLRAPQARLTTELPSPVWPLGSGPARLTLHDSGDGHLVAQ